LAQRDAMKDDVVMTSIYNFTVHMTLNAFFNGSFEERRLLRSKS